MGVPEQQRTPRTDQVHVPVAVDVDHVRTLAAIEEPRGASHRAERAERGS
jgi:hypothetical protein